MLSNPVVGNVVVLISGGPDMTIMSLTSPEGPDKLFCGWYTTDLKFETASFPQETLNPK